MNEIHVSDIGLWPDGELVGFDLAHGEDFTCAIISTERGWRFYYGQEAENIIKAARCPVK